MPKSTQRKVTTRLAPLQFVERPSLTGISKFAGGARSTAVLGPDGYLSKNSKADPKLPMGILAARLKYPTKYFKAGHLLNERFGGDGKNYKNLTILTAKANTACNGFDNRIERALDKLKKFYEAVHSAGVETAGLKLGVRVEVKASKAKWGVTPPECYICKHVDFKAWVHNPVNVSALKDKTGQPLSPKDADAAKDLYDEFEEIVGKATLKVMNT